MISTLSDNKPLLFDEFHLPEQNLNKLSFCSHKPRQLQEWLGELPVTQFKHVSAILYKLLPELNHLTISGYQRLGLMNIVRPYVHRCIDNLADASLKQPPESMAKIAAMTQALQRHICDGYMRVIDQLHQTYEPSTTKSEVLTLALYYAIHGLGQLLYRGYQFCAPRPPQLWKKINSLYQLSVEYQFHTWEIPDSLLVSRNSMSCQQAYFRILILDCTHSNQLQQIDILHLYNALEQWSSIVTLSPANEDDDNLYWINTEADDGPYYKTQHSGPSSGKLYALNLQNLIDLLHTHQAHKKEKGRVEIPTYLSQSLLTHLLACWQKRQGR